MFRIIAIPDYCDSMDILNQEQNPPLIYFASPDFKPPQASDSISPDIDQNHFPKMCYIFGRNEPDRNILDI